MAGSVRLREQVGDGYFGCGGCKGREGLGRAERPGRTVRGRSAGRCDRISVYFKTTFDKIDDPVFRDAGAGIDGALAVTIQWECAVGDFDDKQSRSRVLVTIVIRRARNDCQVGFRFRVGVDDQRHLHAYPDVGPKRRSRTRCVFPIAAACGLFWGVMVTISPSISWTWSSGLKMPASAMRSYSRRVHLFVCTAGADIVDLASAWRKSNKPPA
jgi:hypothetical protein